MLQPLLRPAAVAANDRLRGASPLALPAPPLLDLDFVGRPSLQYPGLPPLDFTRASPATYRDSSGARRTAAANEPRFDHDIHGNVLGLLIEEGATNYLLNSTAPATLTTGSLGTVTYTLWVEGSGSAEVEGNGATITGAGTATEGSPVTFVVTVAGTVDVTVAGSVTVFQLELGAMPTSLIVTASATATRAVESCSASLGTWFRAAEGTMLCEASVPALAAAASAQTLAEIHDGTGDNRIGLQLAPTSTKDTRALVRSGAATTVDMSDSVAWVAGVPRRAALAYKLNDFAVSAGGAAPTLDTSGALPVTSTTLQIGANAFNAGILDGHIRRVAYFPRRLPDAELQAITR